MYKISVQQPNDEKQVYLNNGMGSVVTFLCDIITENKYSSCCYTSKRHYGQYKNIESVLEFIRNNPEINHSLEFPDKTTIDIKHLTHPLSEDI
jgi:hypothetical protein